MAVGPCAGTTPPALPLIETQPLADDELASRRLNLTFRSDNIEGFVRLLVSIFGVRAEWREPDEILLHQAAVSPP